MAFYYFYFSIQGHGTPHEQKYCKLDLGFLVDVSKSLTRYYNDESSFIKLLTKHLPISPEETHVAVTLFNRRGYHQVKFSDHKSFKTFNLAINHLRFKGGGTSIKQGLKVAYTEMFSKENGMRQCVPKILVLITDGGQPGQKLSAWRRTFKDANIKIIVIGVGAKRKHMLHTLVHHESHLHMASNFDEILQPSFTNGIELCDGMQFKINAHYTIDSLAYKTQYLCKIIF